jgi:endonuclease YncB( thermonuclease family)
MILTTRMRFVLTAVAAALFAGLAPAQGAVVDVLSGDVIRVEVKEWRIANIDAPQIENTCAGEMKLGLLAQAKLAEFVAQGELEIRPTGEIDLRNRPMAYVRINGEDVGEKMLAAGLAQRHGEARPLCAFAQRPSHHWGDTAGPSSAQRQSMPNYPAYGIRGGAGPSHR